MLIREVISKVINNPCEYALIPASDLPAICDNQKVDDKVGVCMYAGQYVSIIVSRNLSKEIKTVRGLLDVFHRHDVNLLRWEIHTTPAHINREWLTKNLDMSNALLPGVAYYYANQGMRQAERYVSFSDLLPKDTDGPEWLTMFDHAAMIG